MKEGKRVSTRRLGTSAMKAASRQLVGAARGLDGLSYETEGGKKQMRVDRGKEAEQTERAPRGAEGPSSGEVRRIE